VVPPPIPNHIDLTSNAQFGLKLSLKGQAAPVRLRLEYIDLRTGNNLSKANMLQLKGQLNFYLSQTLRMPGPVNPQDPSACTFDSAFQDMIPPKFMEVHSNSDGIPQVPFRRDWVYITMDAGDNSLLNDV